MPEKKKILLDTNFMMIPAQFGLDILTELKKACDFSYELLLFDKTLDELQKIIKTQKGANKEAAILASSMIQSMINNNKLNIIPAKTTYIDQEILDFADKNTIVATQDLDLRRKLRKKGIKTMMMRQNKYLIIEG
ncbi:MAG: nucleotide-binding protein [Nanoarchaeota archaeon]|nr:nucleotide-binding protein [Nanoarchaeota archaeon]